MTHEGPVADTGVFPDLTDILLGWTDSQMSGVTQNPASTQAPCQIRFDPRVSPRNAFHTLTGL